MSKQTETIGDLADWREAMHDAYLAAIGTPVEAMAWERYIDAAAAHDMARDPALCGEDAEEGR